MTRLTTAASALVGACIVATSTTGCGTGYQDLPLPGSAVSGPTYTIEAEFNDALNLSRGAQVKVNGLLVGRVQQVRADGFRAVAEIEIEQDVELRTGSTARLRYDTPLGELFIQLEPSEDGSPLTDGDVLHVRSTETAPTVEDTLAQASLLINGGGLDQLQTITNELNHALGGNEQTVRDVLERAEVFVRGVNSSSSDFDAVLRGLTSAAKTLTARRDVFRAALRELGPAAAVLRENTQPLMELLAKTERLTGRTNQMLGVTRTAFRTTLEQLGPILDEILSARSAFVHGLSGIVEADRRLKAAVPGDFMPLDASIDLMLGGLLPGQAGPDKTSTPEGRQGPSAPGLGDLLGLLDRESSPTETDR